MRILLIEDDTVLGAALQKGLTESGHECRWTQSGRLGAQLAIALSVDVIVLDLMLPDLGGLEVLSAIRLSKPRLSVLILTASGTVEERVHGLNSGADDYLIKPFAFAELLARLAALDRRNSSVPAEVLQLGSLRIDLTTRSVTRGANEVQLTPTEYKLLEFMLRNAGQTVTRRMLCEHLWDSNWEGVTNVIEVHINRLRNKLDKGFDLGLIHTVRGLGYVIRSD